MSIRKNMLAIYAVVGSGFIGDIAIRDLFMELE